MNRRRLEPARDVRSRIAIAAVLALLAALAVSGVASAQDGEGGHGPVPPAGDRVSTVALRERLRTLAAAERVDRLQVEEAMLLLLHGDAAVVAEAQRAVRRHKSAVIEAWEAWLEHPEAERLYAGGRALEVLKDVVTIDAALVDRVLSLRAEHYGRPVGNAAYTVLERVRPMGASTLLALLAEAPMKTARWVQSLLYEVGEFLGAGASDPVVEREAMKAARSALWLEDSDLAGAPTRVLSELAKRTRWTVQVDSLCFEEMRRTRDPQRRWSLLVVLQSGVTALSKSQASALLELTRGDSEDVLRNVYSCLELRSSWQDLLWSSETRDQIEALWRLRVDEGVDRPILERLESLLKSRSLEVKSWAGGRLLQASPGHGGATATLLDVSRSRSAKVDVLARATEGLAWADVGHVGVRAQVASSARHDDPRVRLAAAIAYERFSREVEPPRPIIEGLLSDPHAIIRVTAASVALRSTWGRTPALRALRAGLTDRDPRWRRAAAVVIAGQASACLELLPDVEALAVRAVPSERPEVLEAIAALRAADRR